VIEIRPNFPSSETLIASLRTTMTMPLNGTSCLPWPD
jgi:hypothetical protein